MKTVFGLTTYMDGTVEFEGEPIHGLAPEQIIREGIGFVPQTDNVFPGLSVRENLEMGAYILDSVPEDQIEEIYDRFPILRERSGQKAGTLSGGQRQMVAMGRALMLDPGSTAARRALRGARARPRRRHVRSDRPDQRLGNGGTHGRAERQGSAPAL